MTKRIKKAVFPVGGLGTRFLPATKSMPKEMLPIVDKPIIQYAFEEAQAAGIEQFIFITGRNKNIISNHFDHVYELQQVLDEKQKQEMLLLVKSWLPEAGNIAFVRQQEPLGLGHAIYCARNFIGNEPFAVLLADEVFMSGKPVISDMMMLYEETGGNIIALSQIDKSESGSYGIVLPEDEVDVGRGKSLKIKGMVEKPEPKDALSDLAIVGRYILDPKIFEFLAKTEKGSGGEVQLTDAMQAMLGSQEFYGIKFDCPRFDCGNRRGFIEANIRYALERKELREHIMKVINEISEFGSG